MYSHPILKYVHYIIYWPSYMLYECVTTTYISKGHLVPTKIHRYIYSNGKKYILWKSNLRGLLLWWWQDTCHIKALSNTDGRGQSLRIRHTTCTHRCTSHSWGRKWKKVRFIIISGSPLSVKRNTPKTLKKFWDKLSDFRPICTTSTKCYVKTKCIQIHT